MYKSKTALALAQGEALVRAVSLFLRCMNSTPTWRLLACTVRVNFSKREHCGGVTAASVVPSQTKTQDIAIPTFSPKPEMPSSVPTQGTRSMDAQLHSMLLAKGFCM